MNSKTPLPEWVSIAELTPLERAYVKPVEISAGRVDKVALLARMRAAAGAELSRMRQRGQSLAIREIGNARGPRVTTTAIAERIEARGMTRLMRGLAVPYGAEVIIGELRPGGEKVIYREIFDEKSWRDLPRRVPFLRSHQRTSSPLGWAATDSRPAGLHVTLEPIEGSTAASDAVAEVRSGVLKGLSVGFLASSEDDEIDARNARRLPLVRRRGVTLKEVSLALEPAYPSAGITSTDVEADAHAESERQLQPLRRQLEAEATERRQSDAELLSWVDQVTEPLERPAPVEIEAGEIVRVAGQLFRVRAGADPVYAVDGLMSELAAELRRRGRALRTAELDALQTRHGLTPVG